MCRHAGFRWGGAGRWELTRGSGVSGTSRGGRLSQLCGLCCVFSLSVSLLFLFPLFAVLLNCPYPDPPVSACFFPFSSAPRRGEGQPHGAFVAGRSQTITLGMRTVFMHSVTASPHKPSCFNICVFYCIPNDSRIMLYVYWIAPWLSKFFMNLPNLLTCIFYFAWGSVLHYVAPHLWLSGFKEEEVCQNFMEWA